MDESAQLLDARSLAEKYGYKDRDSITRIASKTGLKPAKKVKGKYFYDAEDFAKHLFYGIDLARSSTFEHINFINDLPRYNTFLTIHSENTIVISDAHIPFIDIPFFSDMLEFAKKEKVDTLIHGGDYFDQVAYSRFYSPVRAIAWKEEEQCGLTINEMMANLFKTVAYEMGNHDMHLAHRLRDSGCDVDATSAYAQIKNKNVKITPYKHMKLINGGRIWHIEHPAKTVVKIGSVGAHRNQNSKKATERGSAIFAHAHRAGLERSWNGEDYVFVIGMMGDPDKMYYHSEPATYAEWDQTFLWINKGVPHLIWKNEVSWWLDR